LRIGQAERIEQRPVKLGHQPARRIKREAQLLIEPRHVKSPGGLRRDFLGSCFDFCRHAAFTESATSILPLMALE
jgi:hypothetical protein